MIKEFNKEHLFLIRDAFCDLCSNSIERGEFESAHEELEVINTVQSQLGEDEYKDLAHFELVEGGSWSEMKERELDPEEEDIIEILTDWAKSEDTQPTEYFKEALHDYLIGSHNYISKYKEHTISLRISSINTLITICERKCTRNEVQKLLSTVRDIAPNL